jgi:hypothetical protein
MCCQCLLSSLTLDFLKLITVDADAYHLPALVAADGQIPAGPLLLKLIISQAHVDSRATAVSYIRKSLGELDVKMIDLSSNVEAFNFYVKAQIKALSARGETSNDLLMNLFKGCHAANDTAFKELVTKKENDYEAGENLTTNSLMAQMLVKYKARILVGKWSAPSKEQGQILALSAQIATMIAAKKSTRPKGDQEGQEQVGVEGHPSGTGRSHNQDFRRKMLPCELPVPSEPVGVSRDCRLQQEPRQRWCCSSCYWYSSCRVWHLQLSSAQASPASRCSP